MATLSKGTLFDPVLVSELINAVKGHSSLAKLSGASPVSFVGNKEFVFSMDSELDIVAENGAKTHGGVTIEPKTIIPIKFEYGARVSDEFMYAAEEQRIEILKGFAEGFGKKAARALDIAAINGYNPRTGSASLVVGTNNFKDGVSKSETMGSSAFETVGAAIDKADADQTGFAGSKTLRADLAAETKSDGNLYFPELAWGGKPDTLMGIPVDFNDTISAVLGVVGDFANFFKWGVAKEIPLEVIQYGDPDNTGSDLKGHNQVYLRAEIYLGWAIMDASAFCKIVS